jgi:hypothetical protein
MYEEKMSHSKPVAVVDLRAKTTQTLDEVLTVLARSGLTSEQQIAVGFNAAAVILGQAPNIRAVRGRAINAACTDLRERLQKYLPRAG